MVQYYAAVLAFIRQIHRHFKIAVDIIYVNSLTFLVTVSKSLKYTTSMYTKCRNMSRHTLMRHLDTILEMMLLVNSTYVLVENVGNR